MDRQTDRRLARIEGKINAIARWFVIVLGIVVAAAVSFLTRKYSWAIYYGVGAGFLAALALERSIAKLEKLLPDEDEDDGR